jgi:hypothetical protein
MHYIPYNNAGESLYGSVGIATGYEMDDRGSIPGRGKSFFSSPQRPDLLWAYPASYSMGTGGCFSETFAPIYNGVAFRKTAGFMATVLRTPDFIKLNIHFLFHLYVLHSPPRSSIFIDLIILKILGDEWMH